MELSHFQTFDVSLGKHVGEVYVKGTEVVISFSSGYVDSTLLESFSYSKVLVNIVCYLIFLKYFFFHFRKIQEILVNIEDKPARWIVFFFHAVVNSCN